jgi:hypothetical protein
MSDISLNFGLFEMILLFAALCSPGYGLGGVLGLAWGWYFSRPLLGAGLGALSGLAVWVVGWLVLWR